MCCYASKEVPGVSCVSPTDHFSSCADLMKNKALQVCVWILGLSACIGNLFVIILRLVVTEDNKVHSFFLTNLAASDFLMGIYMLIIASKDAQWQGQYFRHDTDWRSSFMCKFAGAVSMLSSEVSVLILTLITADRFINIVFPLWFGKIGRKRAYIFMSVTWIVGLLLALIPTFGIDYFYDQQRSMGYYGRSAVCLPLQLSARKLAGWEYSMAIFIVLNFISFMFILIAYIAMFLTVKKVSAGVRSTKMNRESAMARRMMFIITTDFCCWMPVIIIGILSLLGKFPDPEKVAYVWIAVFVLPINSSINPILYTFSTLNVKKTFKARKRPLRKITRKVIATSRKEDRGNTFLELPTLNTYVKRTSISNISNASPSSPALDERRVPELRKMENNLKLIEVPQFFQSEAPVSVGYVTAWSQSPDYMCMRLVKYYAKTNQETWRREVDLNLRMKESGGHPNILKYIWHCKGDMVTVETPKGSKVPSIKGTSLLICYDFISSTSLQDFMCDSKSTMTFDAVCAIAIDLICAIEFLETSGIVHNSIKTSNILIGRSERVPPVTAVLGEFSNAIVLNERTKACTSDESYQALLGRNVFQFGLLLATLIGHCHESKHECKEIHQVMESCFNKKFSSRSTASQLRRRLEDIWNDSDNVWDSVL